MKIIKRILKYLLALFVGLFLIIFLFYPPKYVYRVLVWQDASYDDFERMAYNPIHKATTPFNFIPGSEEQSAQLRSDFETIEGIRDLDQFLESNKTYAFLVIRNDTLLYEKYFQNQSREKLQTSFSVSKSILSVLVGIAIERGKIRTVNGAITNYIPELIEADPRFANITIGDLLRMKSGIAYDGKVKFPLLNCDDPLTYYHTNLRKMIIQNTNIETKPDTAFKYNNYNALLLGLILERSLGETVSNFMERNLWQEIGTSHDASWSTDEKGFEKMESGFNSRPVDLAKLGRLILREGNWESNSLVSSEWIEESTTPADTLVFNSGQKWGYSYMWWSVIKDSTQNDIFANGRFGQFLYLSPEYNTIIVRHGLQSEDLDDDDWTTLFQTFLSKGKPYGYLKPN